MCQLQVSCKFGASRRAVLASKGGDGLLAWLAKEPDLTMPALTAELAARGVQVGHDTLWQRVCTARSRPSGENLLVVVLMMVHLTQALEPPADPVRFRSGRLWERLSRRKASIKTTREAVAGPAVIGADKAICSGRT
jgi:hypothetical protein